MIISVALGLLLAIFILANLDSLLGWLALLLVLLMRL